MSKVKIIINLDQKNPARVKLKLNILPLVPQCREGAASVNQLSPFEPPENIPVLNLEEEQKPTQYNTYSLWRRIRFWSERHK